MLYALYLNWRTLVALLHFSTNSWLTCLLHVLKCDRPFFSVISDYMADTWFLMGSPTPVLCIVACYLYFVLKLGPKLMASRKPLNMKPFLLAYNFTIALLSLYVAVMVSLLRLFWILISYFPFFAWNTKNTGKPQELQWVTNSSFVRMKDTYHYRIIEMIVCCYETCFFLCQKILDLHYSEASSSFQFSVILLPCNTVGLWTGFHPMMLVEYFTGMKTGHVCQNHIIFTNRVDFRLSGFVEK
jgi:hypothetical protein